MTFQRYVFTSLGEDLKAGASQRKHVSTGIKECMRAHTVEKCMPAPERRQTICDAALHVFSLAGVREEG